MSLVSRSALLLLICLYSISCKQKKKEPTGYFPVLSYIKSQVARVDSSLYNIRKITDIDSLHGDTVFLRREQFRDAAADFLSLPDISQPEYGDRYKEDNQFDEMLDRVLLTYTPVKPEKEEILSQQVLVRTDPEGDKVTKIIISTITNSKDSVIEKRLIWNVDKSFQVTAIRQAAGGPEAVSTYRVVWNEDDNN